MTGAIKINPLTLTGPQLPQCLLLGFASINATISKEIKIQIPTLSRSFSGRLPFGHKLVSISVLLEAPCQLSGFGLKICLDSFLSTSKSSKSQECIFIPCGLSSLVWSLLPHASQVTLAPCSLGHARLHNLQSNQSGSHS